MHIIVIILMEVELYQARKLFLVKPKHAAVPVYRFFGNGIHVAKKRKEDAHFQTDKHAALHQRIRLSSVQKSALSVL